MGKTTRKTHEEIVDLLGISNPNIEVLGRFEKAGDKALVRCRVCGYEWEQVGSQLLAGRGCKKCGFKRIAAARTKHTPESFRKYIENEFQSFVVLGDYQRNNIPVLIKCKKCGYEFEIRPDQFLGKYKFPIRCKACSDGVSYPNKFARALLRQLPVENLKSEWSIGWVDGRNKKRWVSYDNYFQYCGKAYVLELDGSFHFEDNYMNGHTAIDAHIHDCFKDNLAHEHGINVIRVDCRKSCFDYIKHNIQHSLIGDLFDLSSVNWVECEKVARSSIVVDVCNYYMSTTDKISDIANKFQININTVTRYLKQGKEIGLCDYPHLRWPKVNTYDKDGNLIVGNCSIYQTQRTLHNLGVAIGKRKIRDVLNDKISEYRGLTFKYVPMSGND